MMHIPCVQDVCLANKRVLIREDLNVPMASGVITSDARILAAIPTIEYCLNKNACVLVMSHLGRPQEGHYDPKYSLKPVADRLRHLLGQPVRFDENWIAGVSVAPGEIVVLENVRFQEGESHNRPELSRRMAALCDVFVMDAFATAHRAHASTCGITEFVPVCVAGPLLLAELTALNKILDNPEHPLVAIVGGAKVSSKLAVLESIISCVDQLILGGGIANTFIAASGYDIGDSLYEPDLVLQARHFLQFAKSQGVEIILPTDVIVAQDFAKDAQAISKPVGGVQPDEMILDVGKQTQEHFSSVLKKAAMILWSGPIGVFEWSQFSEGTQAVAMAISESAAFSVAGGGDTIAAIEKYRISDKISYISTAGGAFLAFIEGKTLPAIAALQRGA